MKRDDNRFNYGHAVRQRAIMDGVVPCVTSDKERDKIIPPRSEDSLLSLVYAVDPITKLPTGDLGYLVSDKANPEVKNWILQNIMIDVSSAAAPAPPKGLSDDDIASLARDPHESSQAYMERVNQYAKSNQEIYERLSANIKESNDARRNVSTESEVPPVPSE